MERLQSLLKTYNQSHSDDNLLAPWNQQYCEDVFPKYWETTYAILQSLDKNLIEIISFSPQNIQMGTHIVAIY